MTDEAVFSPPAETDFSDHPTMVTFDAAVKSTVFSWTGETNVEDVTELLLQRYDVTPEMIEAARVAHADLRAQMAELKRGALAALYRQLEDLANRPQAHTAPNDVTSNR